MIPLQACLFLRIFQWKEKKICFGFLFVFFWITRFYGFSWLVTIFHYPAWFMILGPGKKKWYGFSNFFCRRKNVKSQLIFSSLVSFSTIITIIYTDENISCVFVVFEFEDGMDQSFSTWSCSRFVIILPRCRTDYSSIRRSFFSLCVYMYWVCRVVCRCMLIFGLKDSMWVCVYWAYEACWFACKSCLYWCHELYAVVCIYIGGAGLFEVTGHMGLYTHLLISETENHQCWILVCAWLQSLHWEQSVISSVILRRDSTIGKARTHVHQIGLG